MAVKQGDKDYLESHSKAKIEFLKKYLDRYLKILLRDKKTKQINIYDLFCGIGIYKGDGSKGSPIVAMELIKNNIIYFKDKKIRLIINDIDKNKIYYVSEYINKNKNNFFEFEHYNLDVKKAFKLITQNKFDYDTKNFIFIDPHGYKNIYKKDIFNLMNSGQNEILMFLPVFDMYRFLKATVNDQENPSYRHIKRIMDEFELYYDVNSIDEYIDNIANAFGFKNKFYTASFKLKKDNSGNIYALFFITKHIKGLEKANEVKWEIDEECGDGYKKKEKNLFEEQNSEENNLKCLEFLEEKIIQFLNNFKTNIELYKFILKNGYLSKHGNKILKSLENKEKLYFIDDINRKKKSFYLKNNEIKYRVKIK